MSNMVGPKGNPETPSFNGNFGNCLWLKKNKKKQKKKQKPKHQLLLHHVGWLFCPFSFCDDESILNTSIIMKTLQIHRTADTSILCIKTQALARDIEHKSIRSVHFYIQNDQLHFETNSMNVIKIFTRKMPEEE